MRFLFCNVTVNSLIDIRQHYRLLELMKVVQVDLFAFFSVDGHWTIVSNHHSSWLYTMKGQFWTSLDVWGPSASGTRPTDPLTGGSALDPAGTASRLGSGGCPNRVQGSHYRLTLCHVTWYWSKARMWLPIILTYVLSHIISSYHSMLIKLSLLTTMPLFNSLIWGDTLSYERWPKKTRNIRLLCDVRLILICWNV